MIMHAQVRNLREWMAERKTVDTRRPLVVCASLGSEGEYRRAHVVDCGRVGLRDQRPRIAYQLRRYVVGDAFPLRP